MIDAIDEVLRLIYGRWHSQILHTGVQIGVFDHVGTSFRQVETVAVELRVDPALLYRLMRALASLGLLVENDSRSFAISKTGELLGSDHPQSLRNRALVVEAPEHYAIWKHLRDIIKDGKRNGFIREFGSPAFEYALMNKRYRRTFDHAMTGYSTVQSNLVLEALRDYDFSRIRTVCDIGGGQGHLICTLLKAYPHLIGFVLDLPEVFEDRNHLSARKLGVADRCTYVAGDMFRQVPQADAYCLKMVLHDWSDLECIEILSNLRHAASPKGRAFIVEHLVPGPNEPHFAKLLDIHMMCWGTGRERTEGEYIRLLEAGGWKFYRTWTPRNRMVGIVEGRAMQGITTDSDVDGVVETDQFRA
jgi:SAM-dependent methyltransferase